MEERGVLVVVLGYGCHLSPGMRGYLDRVLAFVAANKVAAVVVTGGCTNRKSAPGVSEAGMMSAYLGERGLCVPVFWGITTITTKENLLVAQQVAKELQLTKAKVVIFCDSARRWKVMLLARMILGQWPRVIAVELTKSVVEKAKQLFIATPLDVLAAWIPLLEKLERRRRQRIMENS